jgi:hypothetical protein
MKYALTMQSNNAKTGPIPVSVSSKYTCPIDCAFYHKPVSDDVGGCYGANGHLNIHWNKVTAGTRGVDFEQFCLQIESMPANQLWRYGVAGDLPGLQNVIDKHQMHRLVKANHDRDCIAYSHKYNSKANMVLLKYANDHGMTVNLSANNLKHADLLSKHDMPVVVALPIRHLNDPKVIFTPAGLKVLVCPAVTSFKVTCATCGLCAKRDRFDQLTGQRLIVGFPAHGSKKAIVNAIASDLLPQDTQEVA